jgi:hypothetical protein
MLVIRIENKNSRRISWSYHDQIEWIVNREDLEPRDELWYDKYDFRDFKSEALVELRQCMREHSITVEQALVTLYQPDPVDIQLRHARPADGS